MPIIRSIQWSDSCISPGELRGALEEVVTCLHDCISGHVTFSLLRLSGNSIRPQRSDEGGEAATEVDASRARIKELYQVYTQEECTCTIEEQRAAIQEIGHLAWFGNTTFASTTTLAK